MIQYLILVGLNPNVALDYLFGLCQTCMHNGGVDVLTNVRYTRSINFLAHEVS